MSQTAQKPTPLLFVISCLLCPALGIAPGYGMQTKNLLGTAGLDGSDTAQVNALLNNKELMEQQSKLQEDSGKLTGESDALLYEIDPEYKPMTPEEMQAQFTAMEESKRLLEEQRRVIELQNEVLTSLAEARRGN